MSQQPEVAPQQQLLIWKVMAATLMGTLVLLLFVLTMILGTEALSPFSPLVLGAQVVAGLVVHGLLEVIGYRLRPVQPGTAPEPAGRHSVAQFQGMMMLRFALSEFIAILSFAGAFIAREGGLAIYVGGMVVSLVLLAVHVWPGERPIRKSVAALERDGAASFLRDRLGLPTGPYLPG